MIRHSEWRPHRSDPRTLAGWLLCSLDPAHLAAIASIVLVVAAILTQDPQVWLVFLLCLLLCGWWAHRQWRPMTPWLSDLTPELDGVEQFRARISVRKRGVLLGEDQGTVTFVDGWLYFEGFRTSFAFRQTDIALMKKGKKRRFSLLFADQTALLVHTPEIAPFNRALIEWRSEPAGPPGTAYLPPTLPHRSALGEPVRQALAGLTWIALLIYAVLAASRPNVMNAIDFLLLIAAVGLTLVGRGLRGLLFLRKRWPKNREALPSNLDSTENANFSADRYIIR